MSVTAWCCALVAGLAMAHAVEEGRRLATGRRHHLVGRGQAKRRIVGSLLVAGLMVLVEIGLEQVDPHARTLLYLVVWGAAGLIVLLLAGLAFLDLRELGAHGDIERTRQLLAIGAAAESRRAAPKPPERGKAAAPGGPYPRPGNEGPLPGSGAAEPPAEA